MLGLILIVFTIVLLINIYLSRKQRQELDRKTFPIEQKFFDTDQTINLPEIEFDNTTPRIIYRCHKDSESVKNYQKAIDISLQNNPDYEYKFFSDLDIENFIKQYYDDRILTAYKSIKKSYGPARADLFRYLLIYIKGGIYMDVKSGATDCLEKILRKSKGKLLVSNWTEFPIKYIPGYHIDEMYYSYVFQNSCGEFQNWHVISGKGNPVLKHLIRQVVTNIEKGILDKQLYKNGKYSVLYMTGPVIYTHIVEKYIDTENVLWLSKNCGGVLEYKLVDHKKIEKDDHYMKQKDPYILV
jgi:mannosyltransferase OCH1-like enzyme